LSKKLDLVDSDETSVLKTFNDYFEETHERLFEYKVTSKDDFLGKSIVDSNIPEDILIIMIKRGSEIILPKGYTELLKNDILVVSGEDFSFFNKTSK
jgi:cell volume regulation protein A